MPLVKFTVENRRLANSNRSKAQFFATSSSGVERIVID